MVFFMDGQKKSNLEYFSEKRIPRKGKLPEAIQEFEKQMILEVMFQSKWNCRTASELLGITERMLRYRLKRYKL